MNETRPPQPEDVDTRILYSLVIPTLNEKGNVAALSDKVFTLFPTGLELIFSDGGSTDGTQEAVNACATRYNRIRLVDNPDAKGLSPSIIHGFDLARGGILCCMDGDLQHDPEVLPRILQEAASHDFVIGSRYAAGGGFAYRWSPWRKLVSRLGAWLARRMLGVRTSDPMSGFFAIRKTAYQAIRGRMNPTGFKIMLELLYRLTHDNHPWSIHEVGITFHPRHTGKSKLSHKIILQYLRMLIELRRQRS